MSDTRPLIVGAGPTGLAAALFLSHRGIVARVVDAAEAPSPHSKALAVNPRTLELLAPTGVSARMVAEGRSIVGAEIHHAWREVLTRVDIGSVHPGFAMTALSQARSEALLTEALATRGIAVERGITLTGLAQTEGEVRADLTGPGGRVETIATPVLFGADGAHSAVRHALGLGFDGSAFPEPWPLYDLRLDMPLAPDRAHIALFEDGLLFCLALEPGLWRVLGNVPDTIDRLPPGSRPGEILWRSSFRISHRVASAAALGRVALGGDAAHIHSPVGARGMNLGIEDAYVFAACAADALGGRPERIADYGRLRHPVHRMVVRRIELVTRLARGRQPVLRRLRDWLLPVAPHLPVVGDRMKQVVTGLDHEVLTQ